MRRRYGRQQNLHDFSSGTVRGAIEARLENRWHILAPEPVDPMEVYDRMWTGTEWDRVSELQAKFPGLITEDSSFHLCIGAKKSIRIPLNGDEAWGLVLDVVVVVTIPEARPMPETAKSYAQPNPYKFTLRSLPRELAVPLVQWIPRWLQCMAETTTVVDKIDELFKHCNTMGQVKRVWPNLCSFLPERAQEKLRCAKVQSPYPTSMMGDDGRLAREWLPESLAWYDRIITESLLLPDAGYVTDWTLRVAWEKVS